MLAHLKPVEGGLKGDLAMIISMGESSSSLNEVNYNVHNAKIMSGPNSLGKFITRYVVRKANLSNLTLSELDLVHGDGAEKYRAIGRWQILREPMNEFVKWARLNGSTRFTNHIQDLYPVYAFLSKRRAVGAYLLDETVSFKAIYANNKSLARKDNVIFNKGYGVPSVEYAACCLAMEWSSKPMPNGSSFYSNGVDKAHVTFDRVVSALRSAKERILTAKEKGISDRASLIWVSLGGSSGEVGAIDMDIKRNGEFHKYDSGQTIISDVRSVANIKGRAKGSLDDTTARSISMAHAQGAFTPSFSRSKVRPSVINRRDSKLVEHKRMNGVDLFMYEDGSIKVSGPVKAGGSFKFSKRSLRNLEGVHADLVKVVKRAIEVTGQDFGVIEGVRTLERQRELLAKGKTKVLDSKHLIQKDGFGHAVDLVASSPIDWVTTSKYIMIANAMSIAAKELNIPVRWGGSWTDISVPGFSALAAMTAYSNLKRARHETPFLDLVHFELIA